MYLAQGTHPDIAYAVSALSQYNTCYSKAHWTCAKRMLRYLKGSIDYGLNYTKSGRNLVGYVDADWGSYGLDRHSYTGSVFLFKRCHFLGVKKTKDGSTLLNRSGIYCPQRCCQRSNLSFQVLVGNRIRNAVKDKPTQR